MRCKKYMTHVSQHMTNIPMLKETSCENLMLGGAGEKHGTSKEKIMAGVHHAGLCFKMDSETLGDGNCFPRAVRQQCQRHAVGISSIINYEDLRRKVTHYMLESEDRLVMDMRKRWEEMEVFDSWESYWKRMANNAVWVDEPFLHATAWFLNRDILIVWDTATPDNPFTFFSGDREGNGTACPGVPLIIGHHTDIHYQSLLPDGDHVSNSSYTSRFTVDLTKTLEELGHAFQRNEELEEFQGSLKKFANAAKYNKCESKEKKRDLEGFKKAKRESRSRSRGERTAEDSVADRDKDKIRKRSKKSNNNTEKFQEEDKIDGKARENHQIMQVLNIL